MHAEYACRIVRFALLRAYDIAILTLSIPKLPGIIPLTSALFVGKFQMCFAVRPAPSTIFSSISTILQFSTIFFSTSVDRNANSTLLLEAMHHKGNHSQATFSYSTQGIYWISGETVLATTRTFLWRKIPKRNPKIKVVTAELRIYN